MPQDSGRRVIIVGGGASGVLLACHLLRDPAADLRVTLIERRADVGRGIAYATANREHLLNVRAANMSAFADEPDHFWRWLISSGAADDIACSDPFCFVPRRLYGSYIANLIAPLCEQGERPARLHVVRGEGVAISDTRSGVAVMLADGSSHVGHVAVLATGHEVPAATQDACYAEPWTAPAEAGIPRNGTVLILGTGLTMVDYVLALVDQGHAGRIVAMSRRGLLPQVHRRIEPMRFDAADLPYGTDIAYLLRWFRRIVKWNAERGGDWRSVVDGIRPFTQTIWKNLPLTARHRFLEHLRAWWDIHRHRMAPEVDVRLKALIATRRLDVVAAKLVAVEPHGQGASAHYRRRGEAVIETLEVARIVECKGIVTNPQDTANPVLRSLLDQGLARVDPLRIGIEVTGDCAVVDRFGKPSTRLFAVGPLTRAAFWEIVAVPDIRVQCAELARRIVGRAVVEPIP